ncbi:vasopressin V1b receptor-like [Achroia grisella]|uniref:vasopressin V1b receptor-like n=1 Tax=Achroia grisella TaxID=688607 RepID=UPI0027D1EDB9|nr:vasopressin V1b receptor-like [Achroia grisella]
MVLNDNYNETPLDVSTSEIDKIFWDYFDATTTTNYNLSGITDTLPRDQGAVLATYGVLLAIGGLGNLAVLITLARTRRRKSRVDLLMTHLALADVCVTCGVIPLEKTREQLSWKKLQKP